MEPVMRNFRSFFLLVFLLISFMPASFSKTEAATALPFLQQQEEAAEKIIHPGPDTIKEKTGITVFLIWIWIIIFVLVYILRKKVTQADRMHKLSYYDSPKGKPFREP